MIPVKIEGNEIVIRISIDALENALRNSHYGERYEFDEGRPFTITDDRGFAKDVIGALTDENDDGSTPLTDVLDEAMKQAIEFGSEYVEYD